MKYLLKTEVNGSGNKVFSKMRQGKGYIYLAKDENGNIGQVDKHWIMSHKDYIVNLGVSGDSIYPVDIENKQKKDIVEEAAEILKEYYGKLFSTSWYLDIELDDNQIEYIEGSLDNIHVEHYFGVNAFDLEEVHDEVYRITYKDDDAYESLVEKCNNVRSGSDVYDILEYARTADEYNERLKKDYDKVDIIFKKWSLLLGQNRMVSSELASMVEEKYEIDEIIE